SGDVGLARAGPTVGALGAEDERVARVELDGLIDRTAVAVELAGAARRHEPMHGSVGAHQQRTRTGRGPRVPGWRRAAPGELRFGCRLCSNERARHAPGAVGRTREHERAVDGAEE